MYKAISNVVSIVTYTNIDHFVRYVIGKKLLTVFFTDDWLYITKLHLLTCVSGLQCLVKACSRDWPQLPI